MRVWTWVAPASTTPSSLLTGLPMSHSCLVTAAPSAARSWISSLDQPA
jgi:hypothetical protein